MEVAVNFSRSEGFRTPKKQVSRRTILGGAGALAAGLAVTSLSGCTTGASAGGNKEVNFLAWPGHGDKSLLEPFEKATGIKVRVKEYADASQMVALATTSPPGTYDVLMVDPEFIEQLRAADALQPLDPNDYPSAERSFITELRPSSHFPVHWYGGQMYALAWAFNYNALAYNTDLFKKEEVASYDVLTSAKAKGRVGFQDWWSNPLGPISMWAGNKDPYSLTSARFEELRRTLMSLRPQAAGFYTVANVIQNLGTGQISLVPGAGSTFTVGLQRDGRPVSSVVPKEGAVQYTESLALFKGARNTEAARKFIQYCISPEGCAAKAILPSYQGIPANEESWRLIRDKHQDWATLLGLNSSGENALTPMREGRTAVRKLPDHQKVEDWQALWTDFKNA